MRSASTTFHALRSSFRVQDVASYSTKTEAHSFQLSFLHSLNTYRQHFSSESSMRLSYFDLAHPLCSLFASLQLFLITVRHRRAAVDHPTPHSLEWQRPRSKIYGAVAGLVYGGIIICGPKQPWSWDVNSQTIRVCSQLLLGALWKFLHNRAVSPTPVISCQGRVLTHHSKNSSWPQLMVPLILPAEVSSTTILLILPVAVSSTTILLILPVAVSSIRVLLI